MSDATMATMVNDLWERRMDLTPKEWEQCAPLLLGMVVGQMARLADAEGQSDKDGDEAAFNRWYYNERDPATTFPWGTTLLHQCADNNGDRFEAGMRVVHAAFDAGRASMRKGPQ